MNATIPTTDPESTQARGRIAGRRKLVLPKLRPRHVLWSGGVVLLVAALFLGERYWTVGLFMESTDDAYVKADSTTVAPKVSGYIAEVLVDDNQPVKKGQILARIDDPPPDDLCRPHAILLES